MQLYTWKINSKIMGKSYEAQTADEDIDAATLEIVRRIQSDGDFPSDAQIEMIGQVINTTIHQPTVTELPALFSLL